MELHKYTQEEFDALPVIGGWKICPSGDYTLIAVFPMKSSFGDRCIFGDRCSFGDRCIFGDRCGFGGWCTFGEACSFGKQCGFGWWCTFGEACSFGKACSFEAGKAPRTASPYFAADRIGSEFLKTYFFDFVDGIYVRAGCFFGTEFEFVERLKLGGDGRKTKVYLAALNLAKLQFGLT